jgi:hypothetical protein
VSAPAYGLLAEFATARALRDAVRAARGAGYRDLEAYTPFHVEGLAGELGPAHNRIAAYTLAGGAAGGVAVYLLEWYSAVIDYPLNVGGRPYHSWPAFFIVALEAAILCAALTAFLAMLALNGLPRLRHPVFGAANFSLADGDRFYLCVRASDPAYDAGAVGALLSALHPLTVTEVPADGD